MPEKIRIEVELPAELVDRFFLTQSRPGNKMNNLFAEALRRHMADRDMAILEYLADLQKEICHEVSGCCRDALVKIEYKTTDQDPQEG